MHAGLGYACPISNIQNLMGSSLLEQADALLYPPYECTYGGYYGLVIVTPPRPQTFHHSHDNLKYPYRIASIFYM